MGTLIAMPVNPFLILTCSQSERALRVRNGAEWKWLAGSSCNWWCQCGEHDIHLPSLKLKSNKRASWMRRNHWSTSFCALHGRVHSKDALQATPLETLLQTSAYTPDIHRTKEAHQYLALCIYQSCYLYVTIISPTVCPGQACVETVCHYSRFTVNG